MKYKEVEAVVKRGHQIASGISVDSPYPKGSLEMQVPYFKERGLDLSGYYLGTLNLSLFPLKFSLKKADYHFKSVGWAEGFPSEDFLFVKCQVKDKQSTYSGLIYYPDPNTKIGHFQDESTIEVISEYIGGVSYGEKIVLNLDLEKVNIRTI